MCSGRGVRASLDALSLEVGLHQCRSEKNGYRGGLAASPVPSLVPMPVQTTAKVGDSWGTASEGTAQTDSPLEERGFELQVPLAIQITLFRRSRVAHRLKIIGSGQRGDLLFGCPLPAPESVGVAVQPAARGLRSGDGAAARDEDAEFSCSPQANCARPPTGKDTSRPAPRAQGSRWRGRASPGAAA